MIRLSHAFPVLALLGVSALPYPYRELVPAFDRKTSTVMIRAVAVPTAANLDFAAYSCNPVRFDPERYKPKAPAKKAGLADMTFGGFVAAACRTVAETPLTEAEKDRPLAWKALENKLWELTKDNGFSRITAAVEGNKWVDRNVAKPYQEIAAVFLHGDGEQAEWWVKIEFMPWVRFLEGIGDADRDGFPEIYGRLVLDSVKAESRAKALEWMRTDYTARVLTAEEITDWINILASYWYPTMNTDVVDMAGETQWPTKDTDKSVVKKLKGLVVKNPAAVVRGNPNGTIIFNVYVVEGLGRQPAAQASGERTEGAAILDSATSKNFTENTARFERELKAHVSYEAWAKENGQWLDNIRRFLAALPAQQMGFKGKEDWVFFRKSLDMMAGGDLGAQPPEKNPVPNLAAFKAFLDSKNISLLFVPIPNKEDVYYDRLPFDMPKAGDAIVNPYFRKFLKDLQNAGIEVVDVLPHLLAAKAEDGTSGGSLYQHQDTHWTSRGLRIVATLIAERIKAYAWYSGTAADRVRYALVDTTFSRQGDIVERLPEDQRSAYPPVTLQAQQVKTPDGKRFVPSRSAPILLIGDSFTGVFELIDCKSAGVGAHIAANTSLPVDIITGWGGGPEARQKMLRGRKDDLGSKRVVVYVMVARDLYNYALGWEKLSVK